MEKSNPKKETIAIPFPEFLFLLSAIVIFLNFFYFVELHHLVEHVMETNHLISKITLKNKPDYR